MGQSATRAPVSSLRDRKQRQPHTSIKAEERAGCVHWQSFSIRGCGFAFLISVIIGIFWVRSHGRRGTSKQDSLVLLEIPKQLWSTSPANHTDTTSSLAGNAGTDDVDSLITESLTDTTSMRMTMLTTPTEFQTFYGADALTTVTSGPSSGTPETTRSNAASNLAAVHVSTTPTQTQALPGATMPASSTPPIPYGLCGNEYSQRKRLRVKKYGRIIFYAKYNWFWKDYPQWEPGTFSVLRRFVPGRVVLDLGAWIGPTVLWEAHDAQAVVALEPTEVSFEELCRNIAVNHLARQRIVAVRAAMDDQDRTIRITNRGDSGDRFLTIIEDVDCRSVTIKTLLKDFPVLENTGFVKIDTEGYERIIVPALRNFLTQKRPVTYVSLHPMYIGDSEVQRVVQSLAEIFPYLYESDLKTPFDPLRATYTDGEHGGTDVVCVWEKLHS